MVIVDMHPIDKAYKDKIGERLTRELANGLTDGTVTEEEAAEIATYILENLNKTKDSSEILNFLEEFVKKWPIFEPILNLEQANTIDKKEDVAIQQAESLIKENRIDEALNVVESATRQDQQKIGEN